MKVKLFREESSKIEDLINLWVETYPAGTFAIHQISHSTFLDAGREMNSVIISYTESSLLKKRSQPKNKGPVGRYLGD